MTGLILASLKVEEIMKVFQISLVDSEQLRKSLIVDVLIINIGYFFRFRSTEDLMDTLQKCHAKALQDVAEDKPVFFITDLEYLTEGITYKFVPKCSYELFML